MLLSTGASNINEIKAAVSGETLRAMQERGEEIPHIHFVEDRYPALLQVLEQPHLKEYVKLYLVDYGYNTLAEREAAMAHPDIEVIDGAGLNRLLSKFVIDK